MQIYPRWRINVRNSFLELSPVVRTTYTTTWLTIEGKGHLHAIFKMQLFFIRGFFKMK